MRAKRIANDSNLIPSSDDEGSRINNGIVVVGSALIASRFGLRSRIGGSRSRLSRSGRTAATAITTATRGRAAATVASAAGRGATATVTSGIATGVTAASAAQTIQQTDATTTCSRSTAVGDRSGIASATGVRAATRVAGVAGVATGVTATAPMEQATQPREGTNAAARVAGIAAGVTSAIASTVASATGIGLTTTVARIASAATAMEQSRQEPGTLESTRQQATTTIATTASITSGIAAGVASGIAGINPTTLECVATSATTSGQQAATTTIEVDAEVDAQPATGSSTTVVDRRIATAGSTAAATSPHHPTQQPLTITIARDCHGKNHRGRQHFELHETRLLSRNPPSSDLPLNNAVDVFGRATNHVVANLNQAHGDHDAAQECERG